MPFDDDDDDMDSTLKKTGLKKVSSQKSIFDGIPKKPSQDDFNKSVQKVQENLSGYNARAAEIAIAFKNIMEDKVLPQNKNVFALELERDLLTKMVKLAIEINNDPNEQKDMGSISCIILLLKTCFQQRDRINKLEYSLSLLDKKLNSENMQDLISKEIIKALDKQKKSE